MLLPEAAWTIEPSLSDAGEAANLSGIACYAVNGITRSCLLIPDETDSGRYARFVSLQDHTIVPGPAIALLPPQIDGKRMRETDVEGVAFADGFYYVVGSHGLTKTGDSSRHRASSSIASRSMRRPACRPSRSIKRRRPRRWSAAESCAP